MDELDDSDGTVSLDFVRDALVVWLGTLEKAIERVDALSDQQLPPEIAEHVTQAQQALATLNGDAGFMDWLLHDAIHYMELLETQHKSLRESFNAGWQAQYNAIVAQLSAVEHAQLREALARIDRKLDVPHV